MQTTLPPPLPPTVVPISTTRSRDDSHTTIHQELQQIISSDSNESASNSPSPSPGHPTTFLQLNHPSPVTPLTLSSPSSPSSHTVLQGIPYPQFLLIFCVDDSSPSSLEPPSSTVEGDLDHFVPTVDQHIDDFFAEENDVRRSGSKSRDKKIILSEHRNRSGVDSYEGDASSSLTPSPEVAAVEEGVTAPKSLIRIKKKSVK